MNILRGHLLLSSDWFSNYRCLRYFFYFQIAIRKFCQATLKMLKVGTSQTSYFNVNMLFSIEETHSY